MVGKVSQEMVVEELGTVVAVEAFEFKGKAILDVLDLLDNPGSAVIPGQAVSGRPRTARLLTGM